MKVVTVHLDEMAYGDFKAMARRSGRTASDLIREAMAEYLERKAAGGKPLWQAPPAATAGSVLRSWKSRGELTEGYFDRE
jgi:predicted transcriptional regulator